MFDAMLTDKWYKMTTVLIMTISAKQKAKYISYLNKKNINITKCKGYKS